LSQEFPVAQAAFSDPAGDGFCGIHRDRTSIFTGTEACQLIERHPDFENICDIAEIPAKQLQAAVRIVMPADRNLFNAIAPPLSQSENFDVVHVSVNALTAEQLTCNLAPEELEATLCVANIPQSYHRMHEHGEAFGADSPVKRLGPFYDRTLQPA
jgi:hypothetical protein